jgi:hypothetical protein
MVFHYTSQPMFTWNVGSAGSSSTNVVNVLANDQYATTVICVSEGGVTLYDAALVSTLRSFAIKRRYRERAARPQETPSVACDSRRRATREYRRTHALLDCRFVISLLVMTGILIALERLLTIQRSKVSIFVLQLQFTKL